MGGLPLYLQPAWRASEPHIAPVATWALCVELLFWWHEAGARFYGKGQPTPARDDGLRGLVADAVTVLGGWSVARAILRSGEAVSALAVRGRADMPVRAILLTE